MKNLKLKTNEKGFCEKFKINNIPFGEDVTKLEIIIEPNKTPKVIMECMSEVDIELDNVEIKKTNRRDISLNGEKNKKIKNYKFDKDGLNITNNSNNL